MTSNELLLKLAIKYPFLIFFNVLLGFSGALFNGVGTALLVPLLLAFVGQDMIDFQAGSPIIHKFISLFDRFSGDTRLIAIFGVVLLTIILKNAANYANVLVAGHLSRSLVNSIRLEGIKLLLEIDLDFYSKNKIGDIINRIGSEVSRAAGALRTAIEMFRTILSIFVFIFVLLFISWQLTVISTFLLILVALANQFFVKMAKKYGKILSHESRKYSNKLLEILTGIRLIKTVSNEEGEYQLIQKYIRGREQADFESQAVFGLIGPFNEISGIISIIVMVLLGRSLFSDRLQSFSTILLTYLVFLFRLLPFVSQLNNSRSRFANAAPSVEIAADFLRRDNKPFMVKGHESYTKLEKGIHFEGVSFSYPGHDDLVLRGIDLWIPKGQTIALVGASGAGKSTIADLLARFYDPTEGRIAIDGKDLREYDLKTLRQGMGVVSQDTFVFNNSVRYNISYGLENATSSEIIEAAKRANAYEFIVNLPKGFDTEIGDRGVLLSGGQRQRIAIARALLRNPDILILDEATSALDTVSERLVQQAIDELCRDRTTLVIAHRLSTVQRAHQIAVLDKGQIVEIGKHQELIEKGGYYGRLYSMQFADQPRSKAVRSFNEGSLRASLEFRTHLFYEVRTSLNSLLGSLRLVADGLIENPEEQHELLEESYDSAVRLVKTIEFFEENIPR
ncbi:MAG: ATP-binding cassette domain-containing protein [Xenococcaceae cyanobacterium]